MNATNGNTATLSLVRPDVFQIFLQDEDGQNVLGIDDGALRQTLTLEMVNSSGRDLELSEIGEDITNKNYHFCVLFRPGTLLQRILDQMTLKEADQGWKMVRNENTFYFLLSETSEESRTVAAGDRLTFHLENISAAPEGGSRGTRVEIKYNHLVYKDSNETLSGHRLQYLNIVNQRGRKQIPLHVGFLGSNTILNDGTENELTLTIQTLPNMSIPLKLAPPNKSTQSTELAVETDSVKLKDSNISLRGAGDGHLDEATKFTISFDVALNSTDVSTDWALADVNDADDINILIDSGGDRWISAGREKLGITPQWSFICKSGWQADGRQELLRLKITNLKTQLLSGYANLYVHYENIPGYWDGHINSPIHKGPLVYRESANNIGSVGIGTDEPKAKLHVIHRGSNYAAIVEGGRVGIGTKTPHTELHVLSGNKTGQNGALKITTSTRNMLIDGSRVNSLNSALQLNDATNQNIYLARGGGKVGIGTSTPGTTLDVNGDIRTNVGLISDNPFGSSYVAFSHRNQGTSTGYALLQHSGGTTYLNTAPGKHLYFRNGNVTRMLLNSSGNLGIGTSSPRERLHVSGNLRVDGDLLMQGVKPFMVKQITGVQGAKSTGESTSSWGQAVIAGFQALNGDIQEHDSGNIIQVYAYKNGTRWYVYADFRSHKRSETWTVWVLFIRPELTR